MARVASLTLKYGVAPRYASGILFSLFAINHSVVFILLSGPLFIFIIRHRFATMKIFAKWRNAHTSSIDRKDAEQSVKVHRFKNSTILAAQTEGLMARFIDRFQHQLPL